MNPVAPEEKAQLRRRKWTGWGLIFMQFYCIVMASASVADIVMIANGIGVVTAHDVILTDLVAVTLAVGLFFLYREYRHKAVSLSIVEGRAERQRSHIGSQNAHIAELELSLESVKFTLDRQTEELTLMAQQLGVSLGIAGRNERKYPPIDGELVNGGPPVEAGPDSRAEEENPERSM